jgi:hypothetical protein
MYRPLLSWYFTKEGVKSGYCTSSAVGISEQSWFMERKQYIELEAFIRV